MGFQCDARAVVFPPRRTSRATPPSTKSRSSDSTMRLRASERLSHSGPSRSALQQATSLTPRSQATLSRAVQLLPDDVAFQVMRVCSGHGVDLDMHALSCMQLLQIKPR